MSMTNEHETDGHRLFVSMSVFYQGLGGKPPVSPDNSKMFCHKPVCIEQSKIPKRANFATSLANSQKAFSLQPPDSPPGALPLDPVGALPPDPRYRLALRARHSSPNLHTKLRLCLLHDQQR